MSHQHDRDIEHDLKAAYAAWERASADRWRQPSLDVEAFQLIMSSPFGRQFDHIARNLIADRASLRQETRGWLIRRLRSRADADRKDGFNENAFHWDALADRFEAPQPTTQPTRQQRRKQ